MKSFGVGARLLKSSFLLFFVGTISFYGQNVSSSRKLCIQPGNDDDIQMYLTSSKNYYNISRALFPSPGSPSMYVKIFVQFNSSSSRNNSLKAGTQKKYTWSKSCLYVATQFISLSAINVYSVGAVWPNRRGAELYITIPEFSYATEEINAKMIYFLSTLEDVAINAKTQDPRLNTVECVVEGHDDFSVKIFSGLRKLLMCVCWCFGIISFVVGFVISNKVISWMDEKVRSSPTTENTELNQLAENNAENNHQDQDKDIKAVSVKFLICVLAVIEYILAILAVLLTFICGKEGHISYVYPLVYLVLFLHIGFGFYYKYEKGSWKVAVPLFIVGPSFILVLKLWKIVTKKDETKKVEIIYSVIHFTLQMSVHHFLWILLGVMTEPLWAIPVLVVNGSFWFCIYLSAYYFKKCELYFKEEGRKKEKERKAKARLVAVLVAVVICVMLALLVLGVTAQSFLSTDPLTAIVSGALSIIGSWFLKKLV